MHQSLWKGIEDRAMLGIGFMGGLRRAETAALTWTDLEDRDDVIAVRVSRLKTNQKGDRIDVRFVKNGSADAIRKLIDRRQALGTASDTDHVFGVTPEAIGDHVKASLRFDRIEAEGVSAHSLRRAHATELAMRDASIADIWQPGR